MEKETSTIVKNRLQRRQITAQDIMSEIVVTIRENTLVKDAAHLMLRDRIQGIPVVNSHKKIVGMVTITDMFKVIQNVFRDQDFTLYAKMMHGTDFTVREIMSTNVLTISPSTTLDEIVQTALDQRVRAFPVMKSDHLIGIVGTHDILNAVFNYYY